MRLINTETLLLEEEHFWAPNIPEYVILSHTWQTGEEVTFSDITSEATAHHTLQAFARANLPAHGEETTIAAQSRPAWKSKFGYSKIQKLCELARKDGVAYAWCDTCCIDKSSSAELTEAINSMFAWYAGAEKCYAFLADWQPGIPLSKDINLRWFRRGWTLQELIAPEVVEFYDANWTSRGTKSDMAGILQQITGIDENVLRYQHCLAWACVGRKMSWAALRETSRVEDRAYCLMGLFGVHMPLLYGEGDNAFLRLQREIMRKSADMSIFAWTSDDPHLAGVLAADPRFFASAHDIHNYDKDMLNPEFTSTNKGIRLSDVVLRVENGMEVLSLNCFRRSRPKQNLGIYLAEHKRGCYTRLNTNILCKKRHISKVRHVEQIYITEEMDMLYNSQW